MYTKRDGIVIDAGVRAGDRVVVRAGAFLRAGERVRVSVGKVAAQAG
jgi:hypothetical protein